MDLEGQVIIEVYDEEKRRFTTFFLSQDVVINQIHLMPDAS